MAQGPELEWIGKVLVDRQGAQLGACTAALGDERPQWLAVELGRTVWLPASGAVEVADGVQVTVSQAEIASAPIFGDGPPSEEEKVALSRHYRVAPGKADARRRGTKQVLVAGVVVGVATVVGAVLARRQFRARQPSNRWEVVFRGFPGVVLPAPVRTAPAAAFVTNVATRGARLAAAGSKRGVEAGATLGRVGSTAARTTGIRAAQVTAAAMGVTGEVKDRGVHGGKRVGESIRSVPEAVSKSSEQLQKRWRKVMGKITAALFLGVGYILGSRAGRERYDQLKQSAAKLAQQPQVQQVSGRVQALTGEKLQQRTEQGKQLSANARQRAMDVKAKVRPSAQSKPGAERDSDPYAMPGTGVPSAGLPPEVSGRDPLTAAGHDQGEPNT